MKILKSWKFWTLLVAVMAAIITILAWQFPKQSNNETYHVKTENQSGGVATGKIENFNLYTDKESMGIKEPLGLYKNGGKVGVVVNPIINEENMTFSFDKINFIEFINLSDITTFEFRNYIIKPISLGTIITSPEMTMSKVEGNIIKIK